MRASELELAWKFLVNIRLERHITLGLLHGISLVKTGTAHTQSYRCLLSDLSKQLDVVRAQLDRMSEVPGVPNPSVLANIRTS